jgi:hypothetical protein
MKTFIDGVEIELEDLPSYVGLGGAFDWIEDAYKIDVLETEGAFFAPAIRDINKPEDIHAVATDYRGIKIGLVKHPTAGTWHRPADTNEFQKLWNYKLRETKRETVNLTTME